jgi:hypothetical protein
LLSELLYLFEGASNTDGFLAIDVSDKAFIDSYVPDLMFLVGHGGGRCAFHTSYKTTLFLSREKMHQMHHGQNIR